jgi:hypothetical protein
MVGIVVTVLAGVALFALLLRPDRDRSVDTTLSEPVTDVVEGYAHAERVAQELDPGSVLQSLEVHCRVEGGVVRVDRLTYAFYRRVVPRWRLAGRYHRSWQVELDNVGRCLRGRGPGVFGPRQTREIEAEMKGAWPGCLDLEDTRLGAREVCESLTRSWSRAGSVAVDGSSAILTLTTIPYGRPVWAVHWSEPDGSPWFARVDARSGEVVFEDRDEG